MRQKLLHTVLAALLASMFVLIAGFVQGLAESRVPAAASSVDAPAP